MDHLKNRNGVVTALEAVSARTGDSALQRELEWGWRDKMPEDGDLRALVESLGSESGLNLFRGEMQVYPLGARRVDLHYLTRWLVARSRAVGAGQAITDLERYVDSDELPGLAVRAIAGVRVSERHDLGLGIDLLPWDALPASPQADSLTENRARTSFHFPTAALGKRITLPRRHAPLGETQVLMAEMEQRVDGVQQELSDALLCMALVGPTPCYGVAHWQQYDDWVPIPWAGLSYEMPSGSGPDLAWAAEDCAKASELLRRFMSLKASQRDHLRLPMSRLADAMRRRSIVDCAIDLGIALEALFLRDLDSDRGELSFRLRVRAARLLAADPPSRISLSGLVGGLYALRSTAVHTGRLPLRHKGRETRDALKEGFKVAADAITYVIVNGDPNWDDVLYA